MHESKYFLQFYARLNLYLVTSSKTDAEKRATGIDPS